MIKNNFLASLHNVTELAILDNKPLLLTTRFVSSQAEAMLLSHDMIGDGMLLAAAGSAAYGMRLLSVDYIEAQRAKILSQAEAMDALQTINYCGSSIFAYGMPSVAAYIIGNIVMPGSVTYATLDMVMQVNLGIAECYMVHQSMVKSTSDSVIPYVLDAIVVPIAASYVTIDISSMALVIETVKQVLCAVSTVAATDSMTRMILDYLPNTHQEGTYVAATYNCIGWALGISKWLNPDEITSYLANGLTKSQTIKKFISKTSEDYSNTHVSHKETIVDKFNSFSQIETTNITNNTVAFFFNDENECLHGARFIKTMVLTYWISGHQNWEVRF